jgi:hypothetical protein
METSFKGAAKIARKRAERAGEAWIVRCDGFRKYRAMPYAGSGSYLNPRDGIYFPSNYSVGARSWWTGGDVEAAEIAPDRFYEEPTSSVGV